MPNKLNENKMHKHVDRLSTSMKTEMALMIVTVSIYET